MFYCLKSILLFFNLWYGQFHDSFKLIVVFFFFNLEIDIFSYQIDKNTFMKICLFYKYEKKYICKFCYKSSHFLTYFLTQQKAEMCDYKKKEKNLSYLHLLLHSVKNQQLIQILFFESALFNKKPVCETFKSTKYFAK